MEWTWIDGKAPGFEQAAAVRIKVFVDEQRYTLESETEDPQDENSLHIVAMDEGKPVATSRIFQDEAGDWHIGRVAVLQEYRGTGLGFAMLGRCIGKIREMNGKTIRLGAQADKTAFYAKAGFAPYGEEYLDEGNPHIMMRLSLD